MGFNIPCGHPLGVHGQDILFYSFIPDMAFRDMRQLTRYRKNIVNDINKQKNRIDKYLQSSGFRFSAFFSDISGTSRRNIICHIIDNGSITRKGLDKCLKSKLRVKFEEILVSLNGSLSAYSILSAQRSCLFHPALSFQHQSPFGFILPLFSITTSAVRYPPLYASSHTCS